MANWKFYQSKFYCLICNDEIDFSVFGVYGYEQVMAIGRNGLRNL